MATSIIFDLDGTLADSVPCVVKAAQTVAQAAGIFDVSDHDIRQRIGEPLGPMLAALFGVSGSSLATMIADYSAEYVSLAATMERPFDGVFTLLSHLKSRGIKLAIATGKSQSGAIRATTRMGLVPYFDSIHGILPGTPGKPDPAVLHRALEALGVSARDAIMVGDTTFDLDLSAALGVRNVAVSWGVHSVAALTARNPTFLATDLGQLSAWLDTVATTS
jgi:phosphoglycolate phosphatase